MPQKIDDLKEPPVVGEKYLVPCLYRKGWLKRTTLDRRKYEDDRWFYDEFGKPMREVNYLGYEVYPIINHKHTDKENGQSYPHYHVDYRFVEMDGIRPASFGNHDQWAPSSRFNYHAQFDASEFKLEYHELTCFRTQQLNATPSAYVSKSTLKHKCIHKGKCPHRGYDLSQTEAIDGVITCPLHGLAFDALTKKLLNNPAT